MPNLGRQRRLLFGVRRVSPASAPGDSAHTTRQCVEFEIGLRFPPKGANLLYRPRIFNEIRYLPPPPREFALPRRPLAQAAATVHIGGVARKFSYNFQWFADDN